MPHKGKEKTLPEKGEERNLLPVKRESDSYKGEKSVSSSVYQFFDNVDLVFIACKYIMWTMKSYILE